MTITNQDATINSMNNLEGRYEAITPETSEIHVLIIAKVDEETFSITRLVSDHDGNEKNVTTIIDTPRYAEYSLKLAELGGFRKVN